MFMYDKSFSKRETYGLARVDKIFENSDEYFEKSVIVTSTSFLSNNNFLSILHGHFATGFVQNDRNSNKQLYRSTELGCFS